MLPTYNRGVSGQERSMFVRGPGMMMRISHWERALMKRMEYDRRLSFLRPIVPHFPVVVALLAIITIFLVCYALVTISSFVSPPERHDAIDLSDGSFVPPKGIIVDDVKNQARPFEDSEPQIVKGGLPGQIEKLIKEQPQQNSDQDGMPVVNNNEEGTVDQERRDAIKDAFRHAWKGYEDGAFGHDEVLPVTNETNDSWGGFGITLVDSLDTLIIMGLDEELARAREHVENLDFVVDEDASFFEFTIRYVGGLLGAHSLTGDDLYLQKAKEITDRLMPAFSDDPNKPLPRSVVNLATGDAKYHKWMGGNAILSEVGSCQLEYAYLSHHLKDPVYQEKSRNVLKLLDKVDKQYTGLYPVSIHPTGTRFTDHHVTLGGLADSFYEYLIKYWILTGKTDNDILRMYNEAVTGIRQHLLRKVKDPVKRKKEFTYMGEMQNGRATDTMEHLVCFVGGMFGLGWIHAEQIKNIDSRDLNDAEQKLVEDRTKSLIDGMEITDSCYALYEYSPSGLPPEKIKFDSKLSNGWSAVETKYILRPETVESIFLMYRITGDSMYRDWGWNIFQAIEKYCKTPIAYSGIFDVNRKNPDDESNLNNSMQSFFLAETLKYLYLLFSEDSLIPLDEYVFTTEAHPLKIFDPI